MACFTEEDMKTYMTDLGHTSTVADVGKERELHFIQQLKTDIKNSGAKNLFTQYAPLCTLVRRGDKVQKAVQQGLLELVSFAIKTIHTEMQAVESRVEDLTEEESKYFQKILGIGIWLSFTVLEEFNYFSRVSHQISGGEREKKGRGKSSLAVIDNQPFSFWIRAKQKLLETLRPLLKMNLMPIWNANMNLANKKIFYELILRSLTNCIKYGAQDIDMMFDLLVDIFQHYITKLDLENQLIHELMFNIVHSDEMARAVGKIIIGLRENHNLPTLVKKSVIRAVEIVNSPEYHDSIEKGFNVFIHDVGTHFPNDIRCHCLPYILPFSESPVVSVRSAVLVIIIEILQSHKEEVVDKKTAQKEDFKLRGKLLTHVEDFLYDVNSGVRSRAVSHLTKTITEDGLVIDEVLPIVKEVAQRLLDTAITTRKNAFAFFNALFGKHISLAKFTPTELQEIAIKQRQEFLEERLKFIPEEKALTRLNICVKEFTDHINTTYMGKAIARRPLPSAMNTPEKAIEHIHNLIHANKIWEACESFYRATVEFADETIFENFHNTHTLDFYRSYFGNELGLDLARVKECGKADEVLDKSMSESLESDESENMRDILRLSHVMGIVSEVISELVIPYVMLLLEKGTSSDQTEALNFFGKLALYGYRLPMTLEIQILENVHTLSKSTNVNILEPFSLIFLKDSDADSPLGFVKTLISLCDRLGPQARDRISFLIKEMIVVKKLHVNELKALWDIVRLRVPGLGENESKIALYLLYVCAKSDKALVRSLYEPLMEISLGERGLKDMEFAHLGMMTIAEYIGQERSAVDTGLQAVRLPTEEPIFSNIVGIIQQCLHPNTREQVNAHFADVVELGVSIIYNFALAPSRIIVPLVENSFQWFFGKAKTACEAAAATGPGVYEFEMTEKEMIRVMVFGAAITRNHCHFHKKSILEEVKKRKTLQHIEGIPSTPTKRRLRRSFVENSRRRSLGTSKADLGDTLESSMLKVENDELEQVVGQIGFDQETDVIKTYTESQLNEDVISFYWKFVQHVCRRYHKIQSSRLRVATIHLFGQCMLVGPKAMEVGIELFPRLWQYIKDPSEKFKMITTAILLNEAYPNQMQQCNKFIIADLSSPVKRLRLMVLDFVIYLTQTDVLKLRDILADTVLCLADESEEIREVTKNFLRECQEKDTMLHSSIPDIIFRTSDNKKIPRPKFQEIMQALLGPFRKKTELVGIVDKLVDRFGNIGLTDASAEDMAYCLSLLSYGERTFKIIVDNVSIYEKFMSNEFIYGCFLTILESAQENCKTDKKKAGSLEKFNERLKVAKEKYTHSSGNIAKIQF